MPSAGDKIRASDVARTIHRAESTANTTLTTTDADINGATVTFNTTKNDVEVTVVAFADIGHDTTGGGVAILALDVDGTTQTAQILLEDDVPRATPGQTYDVTLATAGAHTLKLVGRKTVNSGTVTIRTIHTRFVATVYDTTS